MTKSWLLVLLFPLATQLALAAPQVSALEVRNEILQSAQTTPTPSLVIESPNLELREAVQSFTGVHHTPPPPHTPTIPTHSATCVQTIKPGKDGYIPPGSCGALWEYFPSFSAAVAFSVLFGILLVSHLVQAILHRTGFAWVAIMASLWEFASYVTRAFGSKNQQSSFLATISQLLVLVAPIWINAFAYMVFARMVHFYSPTRKVWKISATILTMVFVSLDIISFITQIIGGGKAGPGASPQSQKQGTQIYKIGIGMQEAFIIVFLGLVVKFHFDQQRAQRSGHLSADKRRWRPLIYTLYTSLLFITIRIIFRLIEFSKGEGPNNPIPHNERLFYGFEAVPMFFAIGVWNVAHPGRFMQGPEAHLPPSWISRKLCCCCHRRDKRHPDGAKMAILPSREPTPSREVSPMPSREPSPSGRGRHTRKSSQFLGEDLALQRYRSHSPDAGHEPQLPREAV